jgi:hypothetical protein
MHKNVHRVNVKPIHKYIFISTETLIKLLSSAVKQMVQNSDVVLKVM